MYLYSKSSWGSQLAALPACLLPGRAQPVRQLQEPGRLSAPPQPYQHHSHRKGEERKENWIIESSSLHRAVPWANGWYLSASSQPSPSPWSSFPGAVTDCAICPDWEEGGEDPRGADVAWEEVKLLPKSQSAGGELWFESLSRRTKQSTRLLRRWIPAQREAAKMPF